MAPANSRTAPGIVRHPFERTIPIAEPFQAVRICTQKALRPQGAPLNDMYKLVEMKRLIRQGDRVKKFVTN